jgi:hypothetical protein
VGAGLVRKLTLEQNGRLTLTGYLVNALILVTCLGTLAYPLLDQQGMIHFDCLFKAITGLPCPSCGYSAAIACVIQQDLLQSFLHNPGWIMWVAFQILLVFIGFRSLISGRQAIIGKRLLMVLIILIILVWAGKFLVGPEYY